MATADCPITITSEQEAGIQANAFRILRDTGDEWFLDFLVYTEATQQTVVVARVRVSDSFLAPIRDRLNQYLGQVAVSVPLPPADPNPKTWN